MLPEKRESSRSRERNSKRFRAVKQISYQEDDEDDEEIQEDSEEHERVVTRHSLRSVSRSVSYREPEDDEGLDENEKPTESNTDEENGSKLSPSRVRIKIPAHKDKETSDDDGGEEGDAGDAGDEEEDEDDDEQIVSSRRRGRTKKSSRVNYRDVGEDDDEYVASENGSSGVSGDDSESEASELDKLIERDADRKFVVEDDSDSGKRRKKSKKRGRLTRGRRGRPKGSTKRKNVDDDDDEDYSESEDEEVDADSIKEELEDLKSSTNNSPSPPRKNLRERNKKINYQIPPPLPDLNTNEDYLGPYYPGNDSGANGSGGGYSQNSGSGRRFPKISNGLNKGLFPVAGPFGGNDIVPIFGSNLRPDVPISNLNDSSSSDDDFVARPYDPASGSVKKAQTHSGGAASGVAGSGIVKKKKNTLADSDPLGIDTNIDFTAVGGLDGYINQLKEMVALPLLYPEVYAKFGITPPRGVLFHGPPGTGKTLMARALASSCSTQDQKITFFMRKGADCLSKWVGEAERQLRLLFEEAKNKQPSIIFFDEIDGLAPVRSSKQEQIHSSIVSTLLALMDGMDNRGQVIVIGATNRPDAIDPALRRPGRFDREFYFSLPDLSARETILKIHTKKWDPKPDIKLIKELANLTKGYGGSDIRALCTEAALNSIKRKYPQIYDSKQKLLINPDQIHVSKNDFIKALDKIVPSSARSSANPSNPIPEYLQPLLNDAYQLIVKKINQLIERKQKRIEIDEDDLLSDFGSESHDLYKKFQSSRVFKPRLLISGKSGMGQKYLGAAILNYLEGFQVQSLELSSIFSESGTSPEAAIIQKFLEAKRNQPSILFIPTFDIWSRSVPESAKSTLEGLLRSLSSSEKVLLLGTCEVSENLDSADEYDALCQEDISRFFGIGNLNNFVIRLPDHKQRENFFKLQWQFIEAKPILSETFDTGKLETFKKIEEFKGLEKLQVVTSDTDKAGAADSDPIKLRAQEKELRQQAKSDAKLKNVLKIKLSAIMEIFKARYKRFKKPVIPLQNLAHLFAPEILSTLPQPPQYVKEGEMILDDYSGKKYYNMELDTIEERLWNGFYSDPKQFLKDVEMIYTDAKTSEDRERSLKASEMFVQAQVSIDELFTPEFLEQCKELRKREVKKQKDYEKKLLEMKTAEKDKIEESVVQGNGEVAPENVPEQEPVADSIEAAVPEAKDTGGEDALETQKAPEIEASSTVEGAVNVTQDEKMDVDEPANGVQHVSETDGNGEEIQKEEQEKKESIDKVKETLESKFSEEELKEYEEYVKKKEEIKTKQIELNNELLQKVQKKLVDSTESFTVEELELVGSQLSELIWKYQYKWNRNDILTKINNKIDYFVRLIKGAK